MFLQPVSVVRVGIGVFVCVCVYLCVSNSYLTAASVKCEYELHKSCPKAMLYSIPATIFQHHNSTFNTEWWQVDIGKTLLQHWPKTYYKITIEIMAINRIEKGRQLSA